MPTGSGSGSPVSSTARAGMTNLIRRLRGLTQVGTADYTVASTTWWSDEQLQEVLDLYSTEWNLSELRPEPELSSGSFAWRDYYAARGNLEEAASGSQYWEVEDVEGDAVDTADYTADYLKGIIRFDTDQAGAVYYLRARSYNLNAAAAQIWREKAGWRTAYIDFKADDQSFSQSQWFTHCMEMATGYDREDGMHSSTLERSDLA